MKLIKDIIGLPENRIKKGALGIEVEVEGINLPDRVKGWRVEEDGSLKTEEAKEYVLSTPHDLEGVKHCINLLAEAFSENDSTHFDSVRAGVHVHMNVQNFTIKQLFTLVTIYYCLESVLTRWCGTYREGNLFCLRTKDAEAVIFALIQAIENRNLRHLNTDNYRYAALNFCSLFRYGSLEFRAMRSSPNLEDIVTWATILSDMKDSVVKFKDPSDVILSMSGFGSRAFLEKVLPNTHHLLNYDDTEELINKDTRNIQMVAFTTDWSAIEKASTNPFLQETW